MSIKISTFGSCISRNIFNSTINENYKEFFNINRSVEAVNMISLMSNPIDYDETLINSTHQYDNQCVKEDLSKSFLDFLKNSDIEYLLIDTFFDVEFPLIKINKAHYITLSSRLTQTEIYNQFKEHQSFNIHEDYEKYFDLWKESYDKFFKFIEKNNPEIKVILNCARPVKRFIDKNNNIFEAKKFKEIFQRDNYRKKFDIHILKNYDVDVLPFDENTLGFKDHIFGFYPVHYETKYYTDKTIQLNQIANRNNKLEYNNEINVTVRQLFRENQMLKIEFNNQKDQLNKEIKRLIKENKNLNEKYNCLLNSSSWKVTKPMRNIKKRFKK